MVTRWKTLLIALPLLILAVGVTLTLFRKSSEPGTDVKGWTRKEKLDIREWNFVEGAAKKLILTYEHADLGGQFPRPEDPRHWGVAEKDRSRLALTSYHRHSPLGVLLERFNWSEREWTWPANTSHADARLPASLVGLCLGDGGIPLSPCSSCWTEPPIAVVGLMGPGSAAAYARPYQFVDFYEPSPAVIDLSFPQDGGPPTFTFAQDALARGAVVRVFQGPPRKTLEDKAPRGFYRFVVIEPFRLKDTPELDLVSAEAMTLYALLTRDDAVLCFQSIYITYDLPAAIAETARSRGFASHLGRYDLRSGDTHQTTFDFVSHWVLVARSRESLLPHLKEPTFFDGKRPTSYREKQQAMRADVIAKRGFDIVLHPYWAENPIDGRGALRDADPASLERYVIRIASPIARE